MDNDDLMLALHDLMERVEKEGQCTAAKAYERIAVAVVDVAEERGAFDDAGK